MQFVFSFLYWEESQRERDHYEDQDVGGFAIKGVSERSL
jgi:hypothetical protein